MKPIVISLGGSILFSNETTTEYLNQVVKKITEISKHNRVYLIIGGGRIAREYIQIGRKMGLPEHSLDELGIQVTRVNALLLAYMFNIPTPLIPPTTEDAAQQQSNLVIMGGTTPGHSTDMVGAEIAEKTHAIRFIIATDVNGIYDKDPKKHNDAQQFSKIHISDLIKTYGTDWESAGKNMVIDGPALLIIQKAKIPTVVVNGLDLHQLENALSGKPCDGTTILVD